MLSRHERERVDKLERVAEELVRRIDRAEAQAEVFRSQYDSLLATHNEALKAFQAVAAQYTDGLSRARQTINELQATNSQLSQPFRNAPLHKTEEEEDLEFQLDHGVLSMTEYNEALRAAGLADT